MFAFSVIVFCLTTSEVERFGEAEKLIKRALTIDETTFGEDHPDVASDLSNLGSLLQSKWMCQ